MIFLNAYKTPLLWLGIAMNVVGIAYLLHETWQIHRPLRTQYAFDPKERHP